MKTCPLCTGECRERITPKHIATWGSEDSKYGKHTFVLRNIQSVVCLSCNEQFFNAKQIALYEEKLNEQIKQKLGTDWLALDFEARSSR